MISVAVEGLEDVTEALQQAKKHLVKEALRDALLPEATAVAREAQRRAPRRTGRMARSIQPEFTVLERERVVAAVGPDARFFYARFSEFGTAPHGKHPGTPSRSFLRTALDALKDTAVQNFGRRLAQGLEAIRVKRGRKVRA